MRTHGLNQAECGLLTSWLHELGDILHFDDELELRDRVILQPQWLTKNVGIVLRSDEVAAQDGILTRPHLQTDLWPHLDDYIQDHFLRLMDKFDLAYLIPDDPEDRSLIVERLPLNTPNYQNRGMNLKIGAMKFGFASAWALCSPVSRLGLSPVATVLPCEFIGSTAFSFVMKTIAIAP
jgi:hypothetical protein